MKLILTIISSAVFLSGCAMWPSIKSTADIKAGQSSGQFCNSNDVARDCANALNKELGDLIDHAGKFNWGVSYTSLALATATGSVLTFGGGGDALKGLAIAAGSLLGVNTIVNTKTQIEIYQTARKDLKCVSEGYDELQFSSNLISTKSKYNSIFDPTDGTTEIKISNINTAKTNFLSNKKINLVMAKTDDYLIAERLYGLMDFFETVNSSKATADGKLRTAVNSIRDDVQAKLAKMASLDDAFINNQSDKIVEMVGNIIKKREELKKQRDKQRNTDTPTEKKDAIVLLDSTSQKFLNETDGIASAFERCVPIATQKVISGN